MPQVGPLEILVILVVALLVFGPKEIPKVARQAARAWREVQRFQGNLRRDISEVLREEDEGDEGGGTPMLPPKADAKPSSDATPTPDATRPADPTP